MRIRSQNTIYLYYNSDSCLQEQYIIKRRRFSHIKTIFFFVDNTERTAYVLGSPVNILHYSEPLAADNASRTIYILYNSQLTQLKKKIKTE